MSFNLMTAALSAFILKQRGLQNGAALAAGAFSGVTPGIWGLAIPLAITVPPPVKGKFVSNPQLPGTVTLLELVDVVGETRKAAEVALKGQQQNVRWILATVKVAGRARPPAHNKVLRQSPAAGELVPLGGHVTVWVTPPKPEQTL